MKEKEKFKLTKEKRQEMTEAIKSYYYNERQEEIGDLGAGLLLNFFMEELAPEFYNQGVYDAHLYMAERAEDLLSIQK